MRFETVFPAQAALGECPLWCGQTQRLWWVDIEAPAIHCLDPATGQNDTLPMDENVGCIALRAGGGFIAGLRSGLWLLDADGRKERLVANPQADTSISRVNDGRADPWGRFWAGTIYEPRDRPDAALYRVGTDLDCVQMAGDIKVSNGVAFSPDRCWMYHSDTPAHVIYRYPLDPDTGKIGPREVSTNSPSEMAARMARQWIATAFTGRPCMKGGAWCACHPMVTSSLNSRCLHDAPPCAPSEGRTCARCL